MTHVNRLENLELARRLRLAAAICLCGALGAAYVGASRIDAPPAGDAFARAVPLMAQAEVSRVLGHDVAGFAATPAPGGFEVANRRQRLTARFGRGRVIVRSGGGWFATSLRRVGYSSALRTVAPVSARARANVITYAHGLLSGRYANGPRRGDHGPGDESRRQARPARPGSVQTTSNEE